MDESFGVDGAFFEVTFDQSGLNRSSRDQPEARYPCPEPGCPTTLKRKYDVQRHLQTHAQSKNYFCPVQGCQFSTEPKFHAFSWRDFRSPLVSKLPADPSSPHCERYLLFGFSRKDKLKKHFRKDHKDQLEELLLASKEKTAFTAEPVLAEVRKFKVNSSLYWWQFLGRVRRSDGTWSDWSGFSFNRVAEAGFKPWVDPKDKDSAGDVQLLDSISPQPSASYTGSESSASRTFAKESHLRHQTPDCPPGTPSTVATPAHDWSTAYDLGLMQSSSASLKGFQFGRDVFMLGGSIPATTQTNDGSLGHVSERYSSMENCSSIRHEGTSLANDVHQEVSLTGVTGSISALGQLPFEPHRYAGLDQNHFGFGNLPADLGVSMDETVQPSFQSVTEGSMERAAPTFDTALDGSIGGRYLGLGAGFSVPLSESQTSQMPANFDPMLTDDNSVSWDFIGQDASGESVTNDEHGIDQTFTSEDSWWLNGFN